VDQSCLCFSVYILVLAPTKRCRCQPSGPDAGGQGSRSLAANTTWDRCCARNGPHQHHYPGESLCGGFRRRTHLGLRTLAKRAEAFDVARVSRITGLAEPDILRCAHLYADGPSVISTGLVNGMGRNALNFERARACLVAICGNVDRPGGNRLYGGPELTRTKTDIELYGSLSSAQKAKRIGTDVFRLHGLGYEKINAAARRRWNSHEFLLTATRGALAHAPSVFRTILTGKPYPIKSLIVQHSNLIGSYSNASLVREALRSSNLDLVVVHELFKTATTTYADFVIPSAAWLEKPWMYIHGENQQVMAPQRPIEPQYDRLADYDFFRELGRAFGQEKHWPASLEDLFSQMLTPAGLTFEELSTRPQNWFIDAAKQDPSTRPAYGTQSGHIELASSIMKDCGYDPLLNFFFDNWPESTDEFPLRLMSGATEITMTHQDHRQIASLRKRHPNPTAKLNPATAAELDLKSGDWIWVISALGRVLQQLEFSEATPIGAVDAERWWYPERDGDDATLYDALSTNVNVLTRDDPSLCDPAFGTWPLQVAALLIEPLVLGGGGMRMYPLHLLTKMKHICEARGSLFIADEVMTGWGRTRSLFACEQASITPDILCLSKGITGGVLPLAVTFCSSAIFDAHLSIDRSRTFFHSSSYTANPIACAAALANLNIWQNEPVRARIASLQRMHRERLTPFRSDKRFTGVRQTGTIVALDLTASIVGYRAAPSRLFPGKRMSHSSAWKHDISDDALLRECRRFG
jgi:hypothetical protein